MVEVLAGVMAAAEVWAVEEADGLTEEKWKFDSEPKGECIAAAG